MRSPKAFQIASYHHVQLFRGVMMCRGFAQLGLSSELARLQCGSHHGIPDTLPVISSERDTVVPYSGRYAIVPCFDGVRVHGQLHGSRRV